MLLQISNTDTLDSLTTLSTETDNSGVIIFLGVTAIGLIVYFFFKKTNKKESFEIKTKEESNPIRENVATINKSRVVTAEPKPEIKKNEKKVIKPEPEKAKKLTEKKEEIHKVATPIQVKPIEFVKPEKEEQSKEKYIGYNPINIFAQTEPLNYPYVLMPKANSVIKFPRKGRSGRKGYKEEDFKTYRKIFQKQSTEYIIL